MIHTHILGFPRIGAQRELKFALEAHWRGELDRPTLEAVGCDLRTRHWALQRNAGLDYVSVGDFAFYDHVAGHIQLLGCEPARFGFSGHEDELERHFTLARGVGQPGTQRQDAPGGGHPALEMTKWFDTNYHYLVPEFLPDTRFRLASGRLFAEVAEARALGHRVKASLLGPLSFLWLGKEKGSHPFDRLDLLEHLLPVYGQILQRLKAEGADWVQVDEPILGLDLPGPWRAAFEAAYIALASAGARLMLTTYFSPLADQLQLACRLPVDGPHIDAVRAPDEVARVADWLPAHKQLSVGIIDGRNIWRGDLDRALATLKPLRERRDTLWLAPSCSLLHVPVSLAGEAGTHRGIDSELGHWLAFATEKLDEVVLLKRALTDGEDSVRNELATARRHLANRRASPRVSNPAVAARLRSLGADADRRASPFPLRQARQQARLGLPPLPTTTIGSFPQTREIRAARLWVNPDCGLKTRGWPETEAALRNMVAAAHEVRRQVAADA